MSAPAPQPTGYCSIESLNHKEPLIGSAPRTDFWICLEYPHPMSEKALRENRLPDEIKTYLDLLQSRLSNARVLLIRRQPSSPDGPLLLYLADGRDSSPLLYKLPLTRYTDLLDVDIPAFFTQVGQTLAAPCNEPLFLVCTNGKRDICCSKWGLPVFKTLAQQYGEQVWQSSHVGGHRFAPNLVCLPQGIFYGRVPPGEVSAIARGHSTGVLSLNFYRGRAAYAAPVQAAEYYLRLMTGDLTIGAYLLEKQTPITERHWQVVFSDTQSAKSYQVMIESFLTDREIFESCSAPTQKKPLSEYRLQQPIQNS